MIEDLADGRSRITMDADVCVVGGGPAGITLALELADAGRWVVLLESGGEGEEDATQTLADGESVGHAVWLKQGRPRVLGGQTSVWGGRLCRLDPQDFAPRPWAGSDGWPIRYEDLEDYYWGAALACGSPEGGPGRDEVLAKVDPRMAWSDWEGVTPYVWRFANTGYRQYRHFGKAYGPALAIEPGVQALLHANVVSLESDGSRVVAAHARSLNGRTARVTAKHFVLACGGVENTRLLLAHRGRLAGADNDQIGRRFMQHPRGTVATVKTDRVTTFRMQEVFNVLTRARPPQYEVGFALDQTVQTEEGLLNCSAVLRYEADPHSGWERLKRNPPDAAGPARGLELRDFILVCRNLWRRARGRHALQDVRAISVVIDLEQKLDPESRITLSDETDALGMPKVKVDWRMSDLERRTAKRFVELLAVEFDKRGLGQVVAEDWVQADAPIPEWVLWDTLHHMGTTRMSATPDDGVVDPNLRLHGSDNLYVVGNSVFPTGGHANPTLTLIALTLRLADHLKAMPSSQP